MRRFRRENPTEGMRINRLLEADVAELDGDLDRFLQRARVPVSEAVQDRRTEPRFEANVPCEIFLMSSGDAIKGAVRDLSKSGVGLLVASPLTIGLEVLVRFGQLMICGDVRHASRSANGRFYVGITLRDVFEVDSAPEP